MRGNHQNHQQKPDRVPGSFRLVDGVAKPITTTTSLGTLAGSGARDEDDAPYEPTNYYDGRTGRVVRTI